MPETQPQPEDPVAQALANPAVPRIYTNSFAGGVSTADMFVVLLSTGVPVAVLQMSYTVAKTMAQELTRMVNELEKSMGQPILTIPEIQEKLFQNKDQ